MVNDKKLSDIPESVTERVFISGVGPVCPPGIGIRALATHFWQIANYEDTDAEAEEPPEALSIPEFDLLDYIDTTRPYVDRHSECMLAAGSMALGWAGSEEVDLDEARCGLATGTMFGNVSSVKKFQDLINAKGMRLASPVLFPHCYANTSNSLLSIEFGLRGYNQNYCGDHLCGAHAVQIAYEVLKKGKADLMVAGGGDVLGKDLREMLEKSQSCTDLPVGEGAALLGMETEKSLSNRGTRALCEVAAIASGGSGLCGDWEEDEDSEQLATTIESLVAEALDQAQMWEGDIGAVFLTVPWGSNDHMKTVLVDALDAFSSLPKFDPVQSVGHTWAAAYPLQCILGAMALRQGELPTPPKLKNVHDGVETWVEEGPTTLMGDAILVLGCTHRQIVATILKKHNN